MSKSPSLRVGPIGIDCLADVRHMHSLAFRTYLGSELVEDDLDALVDFVQTPGYTDIILRSECIGAWIDGRLCATASWQPVNGADAIAKLTGICVNPLFGNLGIARQLAIHIESRARRAGFSAIAVQSPLSMVHFFQRLGYSGSSRGIWALPCGVEIDVLDMRKSMTTGRNTFSRKTLFQPARSLAALAGLH